MGCDLKVALYLAQLLSNAACQVATCTASPLTPPARWPSAWSGELLPELLLKHPPQPHTRTATNTPSRPLRCLSAKRAINTPPPTACTYVMEGKKGAEEEDSKGKEGMLEGEEGGKRVHKGKALVMGCVGLKGSGRGDRGRRKMTRKMSRDRRQTTEISNT